MVRHESKLERPPSRQQESSAKMGFFNFLWNKLTETQALNETSGTFETAFFESAYRVVYLAGLSSSDRGLYLLYSSAVKLMILLFVGSELWFLFSQSESLDSIIDNFNVTLIHLIAMYRYEVMMRHKDVYKNLATSMERSPCFDISTARRQEIVSYWHSNNERYLKLVLGLGTCTLAAWYVFPLIDDIDYNLVVRVRLPYDYANISLYMPTYMMVLIAFNYASYFVMVNDVIMQAHLMHLLCQFTVLADCFENIVPDCAKEFGDVHPDTLVSNNLFVERYTDRLRKLVDQHKFILSNTQELRTILSAPMLGQLAASGMLICFAGYQVTATAADSIAKFLMSLLYLGYNMFELFIFCRWCDEIKMQSENIREAVYCSGWEGGLGAAPGVRGRIMLVAARAARPLVLTAGGLYDLSLNSYATLVKTSYSALTVLLRVR